MSEYLFIPSHKADGSRTKVRISDIPSLFSEGLEEPPPPAPSPWLSLRERTAAMLSRISLNLKSEWEAAALRERF